MGGKNASLRYKNGQKDAYNKACICFYELKDITNPFSEDDNRHKWFNYNISFIRNFEDTMDMMGRGNAVLKPSKHKLLPPIIPYNELHLHIIN